MQFEAVYYVQGTEDFTFLRADGEGGVAYTPLILNAMPFNSLEQARDAVEDHCGGHGVVFKAWKASEVRNG